MHALRLAHEHHLTQLAMSAACILTVVGKTACQWEEAVASTPEHDIVFTVIAVRMAHEVDEQGCTLLVRLLLPPTPLRVSEAAHEALCMIVAVLSRVLYKGELAGSSHRYDAVRSATSAFLIAAAYAVRRAMAYLISPRLSSDWSRCILNKRLMLLFNPLGTLASCHTYADTYKMYFALHGVPQLARSTATSVCILMHRMTPELAALAIYNPHVAAGLGNTTDLLQLVLMLIHFMINECMWAPVADSFAMHAMAMLQNAVIGALERLPVALFTNKGLAHCALFQPLMLGLDMLNWEPCGELACLLHAGERINLVPRLIELAPKLGTLDDPMGPCTDWSTLPMLFAFCSVKHLLKPLARYKLRQQQQQQQQ